MRRVVLPLVLCALLVAACDDTTTDPAADGSTDISLNVTTVPVDQSPIPMDMSDWVVELDRGTAAVAYFEYLTEGDAGEHVGRTVFASNRGNKQMFADWVPGDARRFGTNDITYATDGTEGATSSGLSAAATTAAIDRAMATWQDIQCSDIPIVNLGVAPFDLGYVQWLVGMGGVPGWLADFTQAGWLPRAFFDAIEPPNGGDFILGATFTLIWVDGGGAPTDIDNNGKADVAFREVYYNDDFSWALGSTYDVETVAFHEAGHGLSQGHFGDIFLDGAGGLHFAPRAVMNAAYSGVQQSPTGTDNGGHCSIWANWPNN